MERAMLTVLPLRAQSQAAPAILRRVTSRRPGAHARERLADQAGDLHLRDADALADLGLGEIVAEAQLQHEALARRDACQQGLEHSVLLGALKAALLHAEGVGDAFPGL